MRYILLGAASLALAATGALAEPGKGKGDHGKGDHGKPHAAAKMDRGNDRGPDRREARVAARGNDKAERGKGPDRDMRMERKDRGDDRWERAERRDRDDNRWERAERRDRSDDRWDDRRDDVRIVERVGYDRRVFREDARRTLIDGCPPGLAKKNNGCLPPGQAKKMDWDDRYDWQPSLFGLRNYDRGDYFYRDGYLLRVGGDRGISGYIPLLGGALAIGNQWPSSYRSYDLPQYYVDYYDLGPANGYRYADNVIYRVDAEDAAIMSVAALLTGDDFTIGQPMPMGYDVYNVPYAYRDRYYDTPEAMYRYSDGYVYRVDPKTQLIAAAIDLLV